MVNYRQPVNSLGQAANIGQGNLLERVSILETRKRILVADASEEFRRVFTGALEEESGLELAAETGDGQETVRLAKELSPDIVVMDFVLARMDGLEVLSELAALPGRPRVLVLSSFARGNMAELAAAHGADYYMMKPCKLSAVMERIRNWRDSPRAAGRSPGASLVRARTWRAPSPPLSMRSVCPPTSRATSICGRPSSSPWATWM